MAEKRKSVLVMKQPCEKKRRVSESQANVIQSLGGELGTVKIERLWENVEAWKDGAAEIVRLYTALLETLKLQHGHADVLIAQLTEADGIIQRNATDARQHIVFPGMFAHKSRVTTSQESMGMLISCLDDQKICQSVYGLEQAVMDIPLS